MDRRKRITYIIWIAATLFVGLLSGLLSMGGMEIYNDTAIKPALTPPSILFPIVWTVLYTLMGFSAARVWLAEPSENRNRGLNLYVAQMIFNFFWSLIFFNAQAFGFAAIWLLVLWLLVFFMILEFYKVDKLAALLQIPYLVWLTFAGYLNVAVWLMNR